MRADAPPASTGARLREAFTVIELLIVIGIMFLLATLSVTGITRSLRVASVTSAAAAVQTAATTAQGMAIRLQKSDGQELPGILIAQREGRWAVATIKAAPASAGRVTFDQAITDEQGRKAISSWSPNVVLWLGDQPATPDVRITWFYDASTGRVIIAEGNAFSPAGAMVGYQPPPLVGPQGQLLVFGAASAGGDLHILAPPTATNPGLTLRSRDQRTKRSLIVQPSGALQVEEF